MSTATKTPTAPKTAKPATPAPPADSAIPLPAAPIRSRKRNAAASPAAPAPPKPPDLLTQCRRPALLLKQVSDATRLAVLLMLDGGPRFVGQMCEDLGGISQPSLSHHIALLRHSRLVSPVRHGKQNYYQLEDEGRRLVEAVRVLVEGA